MNRPRIARATTGMVLALTLLVGGCGSEDQSSPEPSATASAAARSANPANGIPEDPNAILYGTDLSTAFGEICVLEQSELAGAQSVTSTYGCATTKLVVTESKGEEADDYWSTVKGDKSYRSAPQIGKGILLSPGKGVAARKKGDEPVFVQVSLAGDSKTQPADLSGFEIIGKLLAKKFS